MNFSDIKQFIRTGSYEVDVSLASLERSLADFSEDCGLELNPDYQRGHVWAEEQQVSYVEFLLRGGTTARVIYFNSPEYGVKGEETNLEDTIVCVDGLQRLTACRRFLNDEIEVFGYKYSEFTGAPRVMQGLKFNINSLQTRAEILEWYIQFNSGGTVHTDEEINRVKEMLVVEKEKRSAG